MVRTTPPTGLPVLPPSPSSMRAAATTPAEPAGAVVRFPADGSLPRETGGSASALSVSRPARRLLALRPAWSLSRPRRPFCRSASDDVVTSIIRSDCYRLERQLAGRDSHPLGMVPFHGTQSHLDLYGRLPMARPIWHVWRAGCSFISGLLVQVFVLLALMESADPHLICRPSSTLRTRFRFGGSRSDLFAITPCRTLRNLSEATSCAGSFLPSSSAVTPAG